MFTSKLRFSKYPKKFPSIWATLERKIGAKNFQKWPNRVSLPVTAHP